MATVFPDAVCSRFRKSADDDGTNDAEDVGRRRRPAYDPRHEDSAKHPLIETFMQTGLDADKVTATRWALAFKCVAKLLHGKALQRSLRVDDHVFRRVVDAAVDHVAATYASGGPKEPLDHVSDFYHLGPCRATCLTISSIFPWRQRTACLRLPLFSLAASLA